MGGLMQTHYNLIEIGSGPAGMGCAFYLGDNISELLKKGEFTACILDKSPYPAGGLINDGKMNLTPDIGCDDYKDQRIDRETQWQHIKYWDDKICQHGDNPPITGLDEIKIKKWEERLGRHGLKLITETRQRHIGTDKSRALIDNMRKEIESHGIEFKLGYNVEQINKRPEGGFALFVTTKTGDSYVMTCDYLLLAPGRLGTQWFRNQLDSLEKDFGTHLYDLSPIEVGIRIEMLYEYYPIAHDIRDPKIKMHSPNGDEVKTFCTNPRGRIRLDMPEQAIHHKGKELKMINGDGLIDPKKQTLNTNFAILNKISLKDPEGDTEQYALDLVIKTFRAGGWKPLVQRLGKFMHFRRSKPEDFYNGQIIQTTITPGAITPGDINMVYPGRTLHNMKLILERLSQEMPQVVNPENIVFAPEIKFQNVKVKVSPTLETLIENLFVAGNGAGLSSGIVGAASNGILAAKGILKKLEKI